MDRERMDPRLLNAFADGELEPEEAARVVMHLADCPEDQALVDAIMVTNALFVRACAGPLEEPVPPAIRAAIFGPPAAAEPRGARVVAFRRPGVRAALWGGALAAGLAAAAVLLPIAGGDGPELALGPVPARSPVAEALSQIASGQTRLVATNVELDMIATYPASGGYCREFALHEGSGPALIGLACDDGGGWGIEARAAEAEPDADAHYVPAAGDDEDAVRASLDARDAGLALTVEEEAAARAAGWR